MVKIGKVKIKKEKTIMNFGKYEGEYLEDIPIDYIEWLYNQPGFKMKNPRLAKEIKNLLLDDSKHNNLIDDDYDDNSGFNDDDIPF